MRFSAVLAYAVAFLAPNVAEAAGTLTTLATFPCHTDGAVPLAALVELNGKFYGTTHEGGAGAIGPDGGTGQVGTIFVVDPSTGQETTLYSFVRDIGAYPSASLIGYAGKLYGTTNEGGTANGGTVFSFDPATATQTVLYSFPAAAAYLTGPLAETGGLLYGTSEDDGANNDGNIYSIDPATGAEKTIYSFTDGDDGTLPDGGLVAYDGGLYGVTDFGGKMKGGTLFRLNPTTNAVTALYSFDLQNAVDLFPGTLTMSAGVFYGTTNSSGAHSAGTAYAFDPGSNQFTVLHSFKSDSRDGSYPGAGLLAVGGLLYGTTEYGGTGGGTVFSIDPATGSETILHSFTGQDGFSPIAALIQAGNVLLGTTSAGGLLGQGSVFSLNPSSGQETTLHLFSGSGFSANSALVGYRGALYGTSTDGGASKAGSVFKVDPHTGIAETLYSFAGGNDGTQPSTALINIGGLLYGATASGGAIGNGTLFSFNPATGKKTTLFSFDYNTTGSNPNGLASVSGILYGTTFGTLFAFDPAAGTLTTVHSFTLADGSYPGGLIAVNGTLFGVGSANANKSHGTVFSFVLSSGEFSVLYTFKGGADGAGPASLAYANGMLFGSTQGFENKSAATIFRIDPATGAETVIRTLQKTERLSPMINVGDVLYGTSANGPCRYGSIFRLDPATQDFKTLYNFKNGTDGGYPDAALLSSNGHLFGTTRSVTTDNGGTVFRFDR